MNKNQTSGEYLAPNVKVMEVKSRQVLCTSTDLGVNGNPFENNTENEW